MFGASISNSDRRSSRVPLRPKPSVPSDRYVVGSQRETMSGSALSQSVAATIAAVWRQHLADERDALVAGVRVEPVPAPA